MAGWESSCTMGELRRLTRSVCWKCDFPRPSLHPSIPAASQPSVERTKVFRLPPGTTPGGRNRLRLLQPSCHMVSQVPDGPRCADAVSVLGGLSGSLLLVPVWFLSLLCVGPNLLLCCNTRPSDVYVTADNVRKPVCSECLSCLFALFYIHPLREEIY